MDDFKKETGYSASVEMWLDCGKHGAVPLAQAAPTFVIAAIPTFLPPCTARIVMMVDGQRFEHTVRLVDGMTEDDREAVIALDDSIPPF